jgi:hypothetical protein
MQSFTFVASTGQAARQSVDSNYTLRHSHLQSQSESVKTWALNSATDFCNTVLGPLPSLSIRSKRDWHEQLFFHSTIDNFIYIHKHSLQNLKGEDNLKDLGTDVMIILKSTLNKVWLCWLQSWWTGQEPAVHCVNTVMGILVPWKTGNLLTIWATVNVWRIIENVLSKGHGTGSTSSAIPHLP